MTHADEKEVNRFCQHKTYIMQDKGSHHYKLVDVFGYACLCLV